MTLTVLTKPDLDASIVGHGPVGHVIGHG